MLTEQESSSLTIADGIQDAVDTLVCQLDTLLHPIASRAMAEACLGKFDLIRECIVKFPSGFFRSELRTYCNKHGISL